MSEGFTPFGSYDNAAFILDTDLQAAYDKLTCKRHTCKQCSLTKYFAACDCDLYLVAEHLFPDSVGRLELEERLPACTYFNHHKLHPPCDKCEFVKLNGKEPSEFYNVHSCAEAKWLDVGKRYENIIGM
jgi:hypothetical protein